MSKSKTKTIKVPKRVAGVKIPKAVRKGPVLQFVNSSAGKVLVAEAITAALAAVAYKGATSPGGREKVASSEDALAHSATRLTHAFAEGVRAFRSALAEDPESLGDEEASGDADPVPAAKKNLRRSPSSPAGQL